MWNDLECVVRVRNVLSRSYDSVPDEMFWKFLEPSGELMSLDEWGSSGFYPLISCLV